MDRKVEEEMGAKREGGGGGAVQKVGKDGEEKLEVAGGVARGG